MAEPSTASCSPLALGPWQSAVLLWGRSGSQGWDVLMCCKLELWESPGLQLSHRNTHQMEMFSILLLWLSIKGKRGLWRSVDETITDTSNSWEPKAIVEIRRIKHMVCYCSWQFTMEKQRNYWFNSLPTTRRFSVLKPKVCYWEQEGLWGNKVPKGPRVRWIDTAKPREWSIRCSSRNLGMLSGIVAVSFRGFSTGGDICRSKWII